MSSTGHLLMNTTTDMFERIRVPIEIEDVKVLQNARIVNPEHSIISLRCTFAVIVQPSLKTIGPVNLV